MTLDERVKAFLQVGFGFDFRDDAGYGGGYGSGSGYGSRYGEGSGDGYGAGISSETGYGSGSGYGCGTGDSFGAGNSSDSKECVKSYNGEPVYMIDHVPTILRSVKGNVAHGAILNDDMTTTNCYVVRQDEYFAHGETLEKAMEDLRDKLFEDMSEDERIKAFLQETDEEKHYPAQYFYDWHHRLTGSCDMGRSQFARTHGIDVNKDTMTMSEFLELTKNAYGGNVIRKVIERMAKR